MQENKTRNPYAKEFYEYCLANPELRFWQAVRNFTGANYVLTARDLLNDPTDIEDTFYWEELYKRQM